MRKKFLAITAFMMLIAVASPGMAQVYFSKPKFSTNSPFHCTAVFKGGDNAQNRWVCTVLPTEIVYKCENRGGNADTANSHIFLPGETVLTGVQFGNTFKIVKNGKTAGDVEFTDADILSALQEVGVILDPAEVCPNRNYSLKFMITKTANATANILATQDNNNLCVPANPTTCDTALNGVPAGCSQTECYSFNPCIKPNPDAFVSETFNCTCQQHYERGVLYGPGPNC